MKKYSLIFVGLVLLGFVSSCAHLPNDRFNTQRGATIGAGMGALLGQAVGRNTEGTLIGLAAGTVLGALVGNAVDQEKQAMREAAYFDKPVIYYDKSGAAIEAIPGEVDPKTGCYKITKRVWKNGELTSETVEEICEEPPRYYVRPVPPPVFVYPRGYHMNYLPAPRVRPWHCSPRWRYWY